MGASADELERLYRDRFVGLKRALATLTGDYGVAEEVLQEAFARAFAARADFRGDGPLAAWVWRIATHVVRDQGRRGQRIQTLPSKDAEPAASLVEHGHDVRLVAALRTLPPRRRLIVFLRYFADCTYAEIGAICEISEGTVAASLAQARAALAQALDLKVESFAANEHREAWQ